MKLSIITPSHKADYLKELYDSIVDQTYENWEWVLYINGGLKKKDLPSEIIENPKVRIISYDGPNTNVGYIKHHAFLLGQGDALLEVDHDDIITPDCLEEVAKAFKDNPDVGFVFSDNAKIDDDFIPYNPEHGWIYEPFEWKGKELISMNTFEADAASVSLIFYAPDHIRAWRKSVYVEIGGHNVDLSILDDQELMIRTYMVTKFKKIPKTLYLYRIHGDNTWIERNQAIQDGTFAMFREWQQRLAERDADLRGLRKIDIGGGILGREGYETVDIRNGMIQADLNEPWPFKDGEVGVINASHIISHLKDKQFTMSEIHRVLADGGWVFIEVPSTDGRGAFQDPTHVTYWNENSFLYYTRSAQARFIYNDSIKFQDRLLETGFFDPWMEEMNIPCTRAWLRAIKSDARIPGQVQI
jgi:glycosyltransferase involved in cell wall biosynthesis